MQKYEVYISGFAENDLKEIVVYYYEKNQKFALNLYAKIKTKIFSLESFPEKGKIVPELEKQGIIKFRQITEGNFRIIYSIKENNIYIHIIIDSRRNLEEILLLKLTEISEIE